MALAATTFWEVQTGGSDTTNSGAFDPGQTAGMFTDGTATVASGNSPVFTSASYNFVAGDVAAWVYVASGTNWTPGWYKIASVAANAATLNATIGTAVTKSTLAPNTVAGCATTASPTGATWSIDYSQQASPKFTYTDIASVGAGLAITSVAHPFGKQQVGNGLVITGGTNFTAGYYVIASVSVVTATVVGPGNITTGAGVSGTGSLGGALVSVGKAGLVHVGGNKIYVGSGTYSISSASNNVAGGCITLADAVTTTQTRLVGYGTVRGDGGTKPLLQASSISTFVVVTSATNACRIENLSIDGVVKTSSQGILASAGTIYRCKVANCTNNGINASSPTQGLVILSEVTGCTTQAAVTGQAPMFGVVSHNNSVDGFSSTAFLNRCVSAGNTGIGFSTALQVYNSIAYSNTSDGIKLNSGTTSSACAINCISTANGGFGYNSSNSNGEGMGLVNCAGFNNTSGNVSTNLITALTIGFITLTGDPFTNAAGNDFSLNNTASAGAACRTAGIPSASGITILPGISTPAYLDMGAAQTQPTVTTAIPGARIFTGF